MLTNNSQRGFYLLETIVVMSVAISLMSLGSRYITDSAERSVNQVTAQQLCQVTRAAQQYVQDHYQAFNDNPDNPLAWQTLVDQGYLPDKVSKQNHYGQTYQFELKNANRQLQLILTTQGGQAIRESSLRQIAALAGSSAGYATTLHKNKIVGNQEGWFLEGVPLPTGHLASFTVINEKEIMDAANFLRRTKFKDHEAYNRMETDLLMGENTVHWVKNNNAVKLNTDELVFKDAKGKSIGIFNSPLYPHVTIKDSTLPEAPNDMLLNSADLIFKRADHTIHIGVDEPGISISKKKGDVSTKITSGAILMKNIDNQWITDISPCQIRLYSGERSPEVYLGNHGIFFTLNDRKTYISPDSVNLSSNAGAVVITPESIKTNKYRGAWLGNNEISDYRGFFSEITNSYIKIPFIEIFEKGVSWGNSTGICRSKEREGAMFLIGSGDSGSRELLICVNGLARQISWWN